MRTKLGDQQYQPSAMSENRKFDQPSALSPRSWGLLVKRPRGAPPRSLAVRCRRQFPRCVAWPPMRCRDGKSEDSPQSNETVSVTADYRFDVDLLIIMEKCIFRCEFLPVCDCQRIAFLRNALFMK